MIKSLVTQAIKEVYKTDPNEDYPSSCNPTPDDFKLNSQWMQTWKIRVVVVDRPVI